MEKRSCDHVKKAVANTSTPKSSTYLLGCLDEAKVICGSSGATQGDCAMLGNLL